MATAAQIQARIDSLEKAIAAGVLIVQHGTSRVQYQSLNDMLRALARLEAQLAEANDETPRSKVNYVEQTSKGLGVSPNDPNDPWGLLS
jgi:chemotaxis response regulator CheB